MTEKEKILSSFSEQDQQKILTLLEQEKNVWVESLKTPADVHGLRMLPRDPYNTDKFLPSFKTDKHTYTIIGEQGIGIARHTVFQKRSLQRGFASDFQQLYDALNSVKMVIGGEQNIGKLRSDGIIQITAIQDGVADFGKEQFDASMWLCTLFVLREDEKVSEYSEKIAVEKIKDWAAYGFSELDFFLLSGSRVKGYGTSFADTIRRNPQARSKYLDAISTGGRLPETEAAEV